MKKFLILAVALLGGATAVSAEEFAPEKGDFSTEVQFNPFNQKEMFRLDALKFRYFVSDKDALLLDFGINGRNVKNVPSTDLPDGSEAYSSFYYGDLTVNLGYERHFYSHKRLDLYAGAKFGIAHNFAGMTDYSRSGDVENIDKYIGFAEDENGNEYRKQTGITAGVFTGLDFYVYKGLYCGVELGFYCKDMFASNYKHEVTSGTDENFTETHSGGHDFSFSTAVQPLLRLGWKF